MPEGVTPGVPLQLRHCPRARPATRAACSRPPIEGRPTGSRAIRAIRPASAPPTCSPRPRSCRSIDPTARRRCGTATTSPRGARSKARCRRSSNRRSTRRGAGLRIVTGRITSPTLIRQIAGAGQRLSRRRAGYRYEPIDDDAARAGAVLAFGRPLRHCCRISTAPGRADARRRSARPRAAADCATRAGFAEGAAIAADAGRLPAALCRRVDVDADRRQCRRAPRARAAADAQCRAARRACARRASVDAGDCPTARGASPTPSPRTSPRNKGRALVLAGDTPAAGGARARATGSMLQLARAGRLIAAGRRRRQRATPQSLQELADDLGAGRVETLIIIDGNPAYDAPGELGARAS